jgi:hypothetical protein
LCQDEQSAHGRVDVERALTLDIPAILRHLLA